MQISTLLDNAARLAGIIAAGENLTSAEQGDALITLNDLTDSWNAENLMLYARARTVYTWQAGAASTTIGAGAAFNTTRPKEIIDAGVITQAGAPQPYEIPLQIINVDQWAEIAIKNTASTLPQRLFYDNAYPQASIFVWPVPSVQVQIALYTAQQQPAFNLSDTLALPPGYSRALRYNLAVELSIEYGKPLDDSIAAIAIDSKAVIKAANSRPQMLECDAALVRPSGFNWITG